ncbi:MAG TPA: hypothetical protein VEV37_01125 [Bryobacteraceae bacterium]|nr:hypothetical protein [Bryobacteraceae bacterium]
MIARVLLTISAAGVLLRAQSQVLLPSQQIHVGASTIDVTFGSGEFDLPQAQIINWITHAADAVAAYFGRFPVASARILIRPVEGRSGVFNGTTWGNRRSADAFTRISIGQRATQADLDDDWMMTHELVHMAFPNIEGRDHHWIEEGMATYIEPIARAQIGQLSIERVWADMAKGMPQGLPRAGDEGLDHTHTWGRTYWGGAIFWLLADIQIHEETGNKNGLQTAISAIMNAGGTLDHDWSIQRVLEIGDKAAGCSVLEDLYNQMKDTPVQTDLNALWKRLGVEMDHGAVKFNDRAPLVNIRKSITAPVQRGASLPAATLTPPAH